MKKELSIGFLIGIVAVFSATLGAISASYFFNESEKIARQSIEELKTSLHIMMDYPTTQFFYEQNKLLLMMEATEDEKKPLKVAQYIIWSELVRVLPQMENYCEIKESEVIQSVCKSKITKTKHYIEKYAFLDKELNDT